MIAQIRAAAGALLRHQEVRRGGVQREGGLRRRLGSDASGERGALRMAPHGLRMLASAGRLIL